MSSMMSFYFEDNAPLLYRSQIKYVRRQRQKHTLLHQHQSRKNEDQRPKQSSLRTKP